MTRNQAPTGRYAKNAFKFVNVEFTQAERAFVVSWITERDSDIEDMIVMISDRGYKISFSLNLWSGMYVGAVMCKDKDSENYNRCFVYEHTDVKRLAQVMGYLVGEMLENGHSILETSPSVNDW